VHRKHIAPRPMQPCQHEDLVADREIAKAF
jgi:hypothetical protein